jgi:hypothetical protein
MTAQATAMPRQHPQRLTRVSGDRRLRRRALMTAAIALAAPLVAVATLVALGAVTVGGGGGAGLGSLPGADGLGGASGTVAATAPAPEASDLDKRDRSEGFERDAGAARKPVRSTPPAPQPSEREPVVKLPRDPKVPVGVSPTATVAPDPAEPGFPGGTSGGFGSSGSGSTSGSGSGSSGSGSGSGGEGSG